MNRSVWSAKRKGKLMATESENWKLMKDNTLRLESVDSCAITISYSDSVTGSSLSGLASRESKGRSRGSCPDQLCISMAERMVQRKQSRQELEMRYECARKQREEEKRTKEELKLTLDKLRRKAMLEQNRAALRMRKQHGAFQLEREAQQRRELLRQQRELAILHNLRRILLHYGMMPWHRFLLHCRRRIQRKLSPELIARGIAMLAQRLLAWWRLKNFWYFWIEGRQGEHHHRQFLLKRSCKGLKKILEYRRTLDHIGDERNQLRLLSGAWFKWAAHSKKEKRSQLLKCLEIDQIAYLHWQRVSYVRILRAWKERVGIVRDEQKRSQHKAEAWTKIHFWLDEHKQEKQEWQTYAVQDSSS